MLKYILALFLVLGWSSIAQAHVPKVGDVAHNAIICTEEAHDVLIETARTDGFNGTASTLRRFMSVNKCSYTMGVAVRVVEVAEPVQTGPVARGDVPGEVGAPVTKPHNAHGQPFHAAPS